MFRLLSAIFALFVALAQAKHDNIRVYAFTSADCNGPPIYGNIDFKRDKCVSVPFGASSIKIMEIKKGDWTKDINAGPTGCYFYSYTQFGCLERYLDTLVDPGDVIASCIPSRDANAPIFSVSYMCIRGAPPKRSLALESGNGTHDTNDTIQYAGKRRLQWHTPISLNQTAGLNETGRPGDNLTTRHHGVAMDPPKPDFNLTSRSNSTQATNSGHMTTRHHGPAFINGQPNFNSSTSKTTEGNSTVRHHGPAIAGGKLSFRATPGSHKETSWNETQPAASQAAEQEAAVANRTVTVETAVAEPGAFRTVVIMPEVEARAVEEPAGNKTVVSNSAQVGDSDSEWDGTSWDDSDSDDDSPLPTAANSTNVDKRTAIHWKGPRRGVWMLHPWTGSIICYECYSMAENMILAFNCNYSPENPTDCGERPLAAVYTKTISIQPVVTVSPGDAAPLAKRGTWKRRVYMQNPWYPGATTCARAKWRGRNKGTKQSISIRHPKNDLRRCDKSPEAQNIAIYIRTVTTTEPVRTVSLVDVRDLDSPRPVPATVSSSPTTTTSSRVPFTAVVATNVPVVVVPSVAVVQPKSSSSSSTSLSLSIIRYTIPTSTSTSTAMATKTLVVPVASAFKPATATVAAQPFRTIVVLPDSSDQSRA